MRSRRGEVELPLILSCILKGNRQPGGGEHLQPLVGPFDGGDTLSLQEFFQAERLHLGEEVRVAREVDPRPPVQEVAERRRRGSPRSPPRAMLRLRRDDADVAHLDLYSCFGSSVNFAKDALGIDDDTFVGVVVANLIHYKGHRELVRGLSHVAANLSSPWRVLVAGRDHGLRAELEALAAARGISEHVEFIGEHADIPSLLAAADFGLLPSREEGFSNVILEAMAAGVPMIVTNVGGNPEAVIDGETGCVVPPCDPKGIGNAIMRFARNPALRKRLGEAGRRRVEHEFSIERCVQAHADLYQELLDRNRAGALGIAAE